MVKFKRAFVIPLLSALLLLVPAVNSFAISLLPTANFDGYFMTTEGIGVGNLQFFSTSITRIDYTEDIANDYTEANIAGVESMIGAEVVISGATRTGDYSFGDALMEIKNDTYTFFSATLSDIEFIEDAGVYYLLNPNLDGANPDTLNLSNIVLGEDGLFPSLYVDQLDDALLGYVTSGMKMTLRAYGGDFNGYSYGSIVEGLIDGIQSQGGPALVPEPSTLYLLGLGLIGFTVYRKRFRA